MELGLAILTPKFMVNPCASTSPRAIWVTAAVGRSRPVREEQPGARTHMSASAIQVWRHIRAIYCGDGAAGARGFCSFQQQVRGATARGAVVDGADFPNSRARSLRSDGFPG